MVESGVYYFNTTCFSRLGSFTQFCRADLGSIELNHFIHFLRSRAVNLVANITMSAVGWMIG